MLRFMSDIDIFFLLSFIIY